MGIHSFGNPAGGWLVPCLEVVLLCSHGFSQSSPERRNQWEAKMEEGGGEEEGGVVDT